MGCDIHMVLERRVGNKWVGEHAFPYLSGAHDGAGYIRWRARSRNYHLFAQLAGVRGDGPDPKGLPEDMSALAAGEVERWGSDGHSHTWWTLRDAGPLFVAAHRSEKLLENRLTDTVMRLFACSGEENIDDYRLIIWFDN